MKHSPSNGDANFGVVGKLRENALNISFTEARIWLLRQLMKLNLATRDIFHFALKQANIRIVDKTPDIPTVKHAMLAKLCDNKKVLHLEKKKKRLLEDDLKQAFNGRMFKFRKVIKRIKDITAQEKLKKWQHCQVLGRRNSILL